VRAAQLNQRRLMLLLLSLTLLGGAGFMGIKFVEYKAKFEHGLLWARQYHPETHHGDPAGEAVDAEADAPAVAVDPPDEPVVAGGGPKIEPTRVPEAALGPPGLVPDPAEPDGVPEGAEPANVQVFFSVYFLMTGLHGLHVLAGMGVILFLIVIGSRGAYGSEYYTPVDLGGLYWHLVDLIWIFLFPLLYLID
jgi:cytochrome c oxidase subunit 3